MQFLGVLIIIVCMGLVFLDPIVERMTERRNRDGTVYKPGIDLVKTRMQKAVLIGISTMAMVLVINPFSYNNATERQVIQPVRGELWVQFDPGLYYSGFFAKVTTYPNNVTIQVGPEEKRSPDADYWTTVNTGTFAEGDQALMGHTVKWDLPGKAEEMLGLHETYATPSNLANTTLMQYQRETASYSCQRMTSEAHYSGGQSQLKDYFQDQLRNGQVLLITETKTKTQKDGTSKTYINVVERKDSVTEEFLRSPNEDIQQFDLKPSFVSIDYIKYDSVIYDKLQTKIKFAAEEANSKQELVAEQQKEQTAIVRGRAEIAKTTATEEALEQEAVIRARKVKLVAKEEAEQAKYVADKVEEEGRAQAAANRALVAAGLTPEQRMNMEIKIADVVSKNIAQATSPQIVMMGGDGGSADEVMKVFGAERAIELIRKLSVANNN